MMTIDAVADAIAFAEGYYVAGSRAARNNNPGNLTVDLTGQGVGWDGPFVIYAAAADGWAALKKQISKMLDGTSAYYAPGMTIAEIASIYTATEADAWASNVAARLGVSVNTVLSALVATAVVSGGVFVVIVLVAFLMSRKG